MTGIDWDSPESRTILRTSLYGQERLRNNSTQCWICLESGLEKAAQQTPFLGRFKLVEIVFFKARQEENTIN